MVAKSTYQDVSWQGQTIKLDRDGFLIGPDSWNRDIASLLAEQDQLALTAPHWEIIDFFRDYYQECGLIPIARILSEAIAKRLGADKASSRYLYRLFPRGAVRQAARIGGLPKPASCI